MAIHDNRVSGQVGPVIMYKRNNKQCSRSRPTKVRQTAATKKRSRNFSIASTLSAVTRQNMIDVCQLKDGSRHNRLTSCFSKWLRTSGPDDLTPGEIDFVKDFSVNPGKTNDSKWKNILHSGEENGLHRLTITPFQPAGMMAMPADTHKLRLSVAVIYINLKSLTAQSMEHSLDIPLAEIFTGTSFEQQFVTTPGTIRLAAFAVACINAHNRPVKWRKGFEAPASIIEATYLQ